MMLRRSELLAIGLLAIAVHLPAGGGIAPFSEIGSAPVVSIRSETLTFEERVRYQRRIEEVYASHRIWPASNPGARPALDELLPDEVIRERVAAYLEKSAALEAVWARPLTGEQLQAEMNRMARETKSPGVLHDLFAALDDDPFVIAECLARPVLVDRLARSWYVRDVRFHGTLGREARQALASRPVDAEEMRHLGGEYVETEWRIAFEEEEPMAFDGNRGKIATIEEWRRRTERLAASFGVERVAGESEPSSALSRRIPLRRISRLVEHDDRFVVTAVLSMEQDRMRIATVRWTKQPFDAWWEDEGRALVEPGSGADLDSIPLPPGGYQMPSFSGSECSGWIRMGGTAPEGRYDHTAIWTGAEMIVWGGYDGYLNTGGRYDPATDSWTPTSTGANVPEGRGRHTAVWTGTEMIVWGGASDEGATNTGGRYDPATDSWTPTSTGTNVPVGRLSHVAVWTGTEMIVWGGGGYAEDTSGGRYDPATDSWTPTSTGANVPEGRYSFTAVWTGTEMIVWGGSQLGELFPVYLNTGGRYDPSTNTWRATSTGANVPTGRIWHTAVWTGKEMILWAGYSYYTGTVNTGGRYDPVADTWLATTETDVPLERYRHTAVWTGTEMIVWGGSYRLNSGGRYDPTADTWTATTIGANTPTRRSEHTAVWTGTEMIVWGGENGLSTGGRYDPATDDLPDTDGDGVCDDVDICLSTPNPSQNDADLDGVGDACDNCPGDFNHGQSDVDSDGLGDACDACPLDSDNDADQDGVCGNVDNCPEFNPGQEDADGDGIGDICDPCSTPGNNDSDGDGVCDLEDSCPSVANPAQVDVDGDGLGDECDICPRDPLNDQDVDGVCDGTDNCPGEFNAGQSDVDIDGIGDVCDACPLDPANDADQDDVCGNLDNCSLVANLDQVDADGDGAGDACDCRPQDSGARPPEVVLGPNVSDSGSVIVLQWQPVPGADTYAVRRAVRSELIDGSFGPCAASSVTETSFADGATPTPGEAFFYLVQGISTECGPGSLGFDSSWQDRGAPACQ